MKMPPIGLTHLQSPDRESTDRALRTPAGVSALTVLVKLFKRLNELELRYCHWKSNEHLTASMMGTTDVDILVDRRMIVDLTRVLGEHGFKRFLVHPGRGYPGIEDYVGFDHTTGILTHLHIHYQLTLGEKFLKGHRLPWEEVFLSTRVLDKPFGLYVADPHLELLVLVVRAVMKLRLRDRWLEGLGKSYFVGGMLRELRWLVERIDPARVQSLASGLIGSRAANLLPELLTGSPPTVRQLRALGRMVDPPLSSYRLYDTSDALRQMLMREGRTVWWKLRNWYLGTTAQSTRTLPQGGLFVAILGLDGAGKTTLTDQIAQWLSREVAVSTTYGGSGKGSAALPRRVMQTAAAWYRRLRKSRRSVAAVAPREEVSRPPSLPRLVWLLALIRERRRRAATTRRAKALGMVVISDRLPQSQFPGWNDGPRLGHWLQDGSFARRYAARQEAAAFRLVDLVPPDLVIKLHVSPRVASERKPETPQQQLLNGVRMVRGLQFPPTTRVLDLDAEQPLADVVLQAKRAVWESL
jgi:thymidylate kinase